MYASWAMAVTAPGPLGSLVSLPMNGLTWVGVHPDLRRRGILRQMMTEHLTTAHDHGEAVAGLQAAEPGIYGRFGYGAASLDVTLTLGRGTELAAGEALDAAAEQVSTHMVPAGTPEAMAVIQRAHLRAAEHTLGAVTRTEEMAGVWFRDFPVARGSKEPLQVLFATRDDDVCGYALVRRSSKWEHNVPGGEVTVREIGATDPAALLALARRVVDFDLTGKVTLHGRGLDDPILWWAGGPRPTSLRAGDSLWVRLVDVDKALTARGYAAPADVVLDVLDPVCPWNQRRWRLTVGSDGVGRCLPTDDAPDLRMPVTALGAAYLGSRPIAGQTVVGTVTELRPGAAAELSRAMRGDVEPVAAIGF
nr:GNAT family N-acetyltransferase [Ornithinimicrobium sp. F0845]